MDKEVDEIILLINIGFMGVLKNYVLLIIVIEVGVMLFWVNKEWILIVFMGGFGFVK